MSTTRSPGAPGALRAMGAPMTTAAHTAATKAAHGKRPPPNSCHAWTNASRGWPTPRTGSAGRWRRSSNRIGDPDDVPGQEPPRVTTIDRLRHPSISEAGTRAAGINPEPIPSGGVTRWTAQARQDCVPRRAADLMDKRARPRSKRPRPRSGRGVRCTRHPCRQASLRVSPRRGAGRPHPPAMGARSVIHCVQHPARSSSYIRLAVSV